MPTTKIADLPDRRTCSDPEHEPPNMMSWLPGVYAHTCPSCGNVITFVVPNNTHSWFFKVKHE